MVHVVRWENIQSRLRYKLGELFSQEESIRPIVRDVDSTLESLIIWKGNAVDCWSGILKDVRIRHLVLDLIEAAQLAYPQDEGLQKAKDDFKMLTLGTTSTVVTSNSRPPQSLHSKFIHDIFGMRGTNHPVIDTRTCIFISHNAMGDTSAEEVLKNLSRELDKAGFMVLLDTQRPLQFNEEWRRSVYLCMQQCHAAVVLFSESALTSKWVEYEAKMLNARKYLNPRFMIIPLLLPSIGQDQLAKYHFSISIMDELQQVSGNFSFLPIIEQFASLKDIFPDNPLQKLGAVIASWLNKLNWGTIRSVALELGANISSWPQDVENCKILLAQELLKAELPKVCNIIHELAPNMEQKHANDMMGILAPSWIDERAIAPISKIVSRPLIRRTMCLNSEKPHTGKMYIRHACNGSPKAIPGWPTIDAFTPSGEYQLEALERQILDGFRNTFVYEDENDTFIMELLSRPRAILEPFIVFVPGYLDREVLDKLRVKYVGVTFFLLSSDESIDEQELEKNNIELLLPLLDHGQELDAYNALGTLRRRDVLQKTF